MSVEVVVVVLVVGLAILASIASRKKSYSFNQRIVLSAIAVALLVWNYYSRQTGGIDQGKAVLVAVVVLVLVSSVLYLRNSNKN